MTLSNIWIFQRNLHEHKLLEDKQSFKFGGVINVYFTRLLFPFLDLLWLISSRLMNNLMVFCLNVQKMTKSRKLKSKRAKVKISASPDRSGTLADRSGLQEKKRRIPEALAIDRATCADRSPEPDRSRTTCRSIGHARQNRRNPEHLAIDRAARPDRSVKAR